MISRMTNLNDNIMEVNLQNDYAKSASANSVNQNPH